MNRLLSAFLLFLTVLPVPAAEKGAAKPNTLTPKEIADGWILLFDGETTFGWKVDGPAEVAGGVLRLGGKKDTFAGPDTEFGACDFSFEFEAGEISKSEVIVVGWETTFKALAGNLRG